MELADSSGSVKQSYRRESGLEKSRWVAKDGVSRSLRYTAQRDTEADQA